MIKGNHNQEETKRVKCTLRRLLGRLEETIMYIGFIYNSADGTWDYITTIQEA